MRKIVALGTTVLALFAAAIGTTLAIEHTNAPRGSVTPPIVNDVHNAPECSEGICRQ